jgi:hypothetical protein
MNSGVDEAEYVEAIVNSEIIEQANSLHRPDQWIFQQDGAPAHTSRAALDALFFNDASACWLASSKSGYECDGDDCN